MNINEIDPLAKLLTPQEAFLKGSTSDGIIREVGDFYRPEAVTSRELSAQKANIERERFGTYPLGYIGVAMGAENAAIKLEGLDLKTGKTIRDPRIGFLDEDGNFVFNEALTEKLYKLYAENNINLQLRESSILIEGERPGTENKG